MRRAVVAALVALLVVVWTATSSTTSSFTSAVLADPGNQGGSGRLVFGQTYQSTSCSLDARTASSIACGGSVLPTTAVVASPGTNAGNSITNQGTLPAARLTERVSAASCATVQLANAKSGSRPMLPRYATTFGASGPFGGTNAVTLNGSTAYAASVEQQSLSIPLVGVGTTNGYGVWFKLAAGSGGGPLLSFGSSPTASGTTNDRILFVNASGQLGFVANTSGSTLTQAGGTSLLDSTWHFAYAVTTITNVLFVGVSLAVTLYVDGTQVATSGSLLNGPSSYNGYWHLGWAPTSATGLANAYLSGSVSNVVVFDSSPAAAAPNSTQRRLSGRLHLVGQQRHRALDPRRHRHHHLHRRPTGHRLDVPVLDGHHRLVVHQPVRHRDEHDPALSLRHGHHLHGDCAGARRDADLDGHAGAPRQLQRLRVGTAPQGADHDRGPHQPGEHLVGRVHLGERRRGGHRMTRALSAESAQSRWWRMVERLALAAVLVAVAGALSWRLDGGHWERVETPSMGTAAPVGTLLWVKPVDFDGLLVGDIITFQPPGAPSTVSHRVLSRNVDHTLTTGGDLAGTDPWRVAPEDVVGRVEHRWQGVGWLVAAAPILVLGATILMGLVRFAARGAWKLPVAIVGAAFVLCTVIVVQRPLVRADQLSFVGVDAGAEATYVSTGVLPVRISAPSGAHVDLRSGESGSVVSREPDDLDEYAVEVAAHLPRGWWLAVVLTCFLPALGSLRRSSRTSPRRTPSG